MSSLAAYGVDGPYWTVAHHDGYVLLTIDPCIDVAEAISVLLGTDSARRWTVESLDDDIDGREVWLLLRA